MRLRTATSLIFIALFFCAQARAVRAASDPPDPLMGPYIQDPALMITLDCPELESAQTSEECSGPLNFAKLIRRRLQSAKSPQAFFQPGVNPFTLIEANRIASIVKADLQEIRAREFALSSQLSPEFLVDQGSRVELVGIINRMDRQFLGEHRESDCGEISLIYRFAYSIRDGKQKSRLPVTMNIVFPATSAYHDCQIVARSWLKWINRPSSKATSQTVKELFDTLNGPLASLAESHISRLELNMQAYRKPASEDMTNFGTEAAYLIRVFRWDDGTGRFEPSDLPNQIDRRAVTCEPSDSFAICGSKEGTRRRLVRYLQQPQVVASIDNGTLNIPSWLGVLSRRAVSISPGGSHRSGNQPYWKALPSEKSDLPNEQDVISNRDIIVALNRARKAGIRLSHIGSVEDFRTRLNDSTCTGCHQTRAIAGFHFPGADRPGTPPPNSVFLPGSPHFYGDQPRRRAILESIANHETGRLAAAKLTMNYSARPNSLFEAALKSTELIGGWGGACLMPEFLQNSKRKWNCRPGLHCARLFDSNNDPGIGTCLPDGTSQIGDALQLGVIDTLAFARDVYSRVKPQPIANDTRIPSSALPANPPTGNSYFGAHQEFYEGVDPNSAPDCKTKPPQPTCYDIRRDQSTGGFPAGMLRLSECIGLPDEATCGLVASSGFNACISKIANGSDDYDVDRCLYYFTSFAGLRACDRANPCRDDYICVAPMGYTPSNADEKYDERLRRLTSDKYFYDVTCRIYDVNDYGQKRPDPRWVARNDNDRRGICIPPYFVFQFRSDGHPSPPHMKSSSTLSCPPRP